MEIGAPLVNETDCAGSDLPDIMQGKP